MKVVDLLADRRKNWHELERLCVLQETRSRRKIGPEGLLRFGSLYRSACADLALADAYQLPPHTVHYLHQLVGRAHNQLYRSRQFQFSTWIKEMLFELPRRLYRDNCVRACFLLFWSLFLGSMLLAYTSPEFAEAAIGKPQMQELEAMYEESFESMDANERSAAVGGYILRNAGIGMRSFVLGPVLIGMITMIYNAYFLGAVFGHMATTPMSDNFFTFVTAHGPFEINSVVLATAAGLKLGLSVIFTGGMTRRASMLRAAREAVPAACLAAILFALAALIESYISPSPAPYWFKALVAVATSGILMFYFVMFGRSGLPAKKTQD